MIKDLNVYLGIKDPDLLVARTLFLRTLHFP